MRSALLFSLFLIAAPCALLTGCSVLSGDSKTSLNEVDGLLSRIESVQVESTVAKERARAALEMLEKLARPDFAGDAAQTYSGFVASIDASEKQAAKFSESVEPMKESAEDVFKQWTKDLEAIGNTRLRAASHVRMEETRARYEAVVTATATAQVTLDAFNADLHDHALFLGHDFNHAAVTAIASEVVALAERSKELDQRLDACDAAARRYVEAAALHGQLTATKPGSKGAPAAAAPTPVATTQQQPAAPVVEPAAPKKSVATLPPRADGQSAPAASSQSTPDSTPPKF
ncbi:MAG: DUF2959 family protein [Planctomycetes bacterium]|nr:DUF2959 family protein [Planctomycetota bacterium]